MRPPIAIAVLACLGALAVGCGRQEASTPAACLKGASAYLNALSAAPGEVRLAGETPISECLVENQQAGDLATVGEAMVEAATGLNAEARADPGGGGAVELGYLLGAAVRGAEHTAGIHANLVRRLTVAARYSPGKEPLSPAFLAAYRRGFDAGRRRG